MGLPKPAGVALSRRRAGPPPHTTRALLPCEAGCEGWVRHEFVARQPVHALQDGFPTGEHILDQLIFRDAAGYERVWGNEGRQ